MPLLDRVRNVRFAQARTLATACISTSSRDFHVLVTTSHVALVFAEKRPNSRGAGRKNDDVDFDDDPNFELGDIVGEVAGSRKIGILNGFDNGRGESAVDRLAKLSSNPEM